VELVSVFGLSVNRFWLPRHWVEINASFHTLCRHLSVLQHSPFVAVLLDDLRALHQDAWLAWIAYSRLVFSGESEAHVFYQTHGGTAPAALDPPPSTPDAFKTAHVQLHVAACALSDTHTIILEVEDLFQ